jgi:nucleotide-binding universal stress UspA family protein
MVEIRRILCAIDFSDISRHALEHAVAVAKWYDAEITALHATYPRFVPQPPIFFAEPPHSVLAAEDSRELAETQLRRWLDEVAGAGVKTRAVIEEGHAAPAILRLAADLQADLIVVGTHGVTGFDRLVLGSVAERVLRKASCPVMTVPPAVAGTPHLPYARVMCPVDFSESSLVALQFGFSIAQEANAHLTILHVLGWPAGETLGFDDLDTPEFRQRVEAEARRRLDALVTDEQRVWCEPATQVACGKPYEQILKSAAIDRADLIVMGVRGRNPVDLTVFGSTTNQVIRRAACPVLTLRG